jgi:O-antigen/teichoic acid export membrane protein
VKALTEASAAGTASADLNLGTIPELVRKWAPRGLAALTDQGLISGSNFIAGVALAHSAGPGPYGAYMLLFAAFLLIANIHQALVLEPASVFAFALFPKRPDRYLRVVLLMHAVFTTAFLGVGGAAVLLAPRLHMPGAIANALSGMVAAVPCVLLFWLARCFAYLEFAPAIAVRGSMVYCAILAGLLMAAWRTAGLSPGIIFICTAIAAVAGGARLLAVWLPWRPADGPEPSLSEVWRRHWGYGRWALGSVGLAWAQTNAISFIGGWLLGLREVGALNALAALLLPMFQMLASATRLSLPRVSQIYSGGGVEAATRPVLRIALTLTALTAAYALAISVLREPVFRHLYGAAFTPYAWMVPIFSLHIVAWGVITACDIGFNSIRAPRAAFHVKALMVAIMIPVNTLLAWRFGLPGAAAGVPVFSALTAFFLALRLRAEWRQHAFPEGARTAPAA